MLAASAVTFTGILDLFYFYKIIKSFIRLRNQLKSIKDISIMDVPQLFDKFNQLKTYQDHHIAVQGYVKGVGDKNILSSIVKTDIIQRSSRKKFLFEKMPFKNIIQNATSLRPSNLKEVSFRIEDTLKKQNIFVQDCQKSDLTGAFTERKSFEVRVKESKNLLLIILRTIYDFILSIFPLSMLKQKRKAGERITYYGILEDDFLVVSGKAYKDSHGNIHMKKPQYIAKQLTFIIKRLKKKFKIIKTFFLFILIAHLVGLYYFGNWIYKKYLSNISIREVQDDEEQEIKPNHECIICYSAVRSVILKPCKHYALCYNCYYRLNNDQCPICKKQISGIIRVLKR